MTKSLWLHVSRVHFSLVKHCGGHRLRQWSVSKQLFANKCGSPHRKVEQMTPTGAPEFPACAKRTVQPSETLMRGEPYFGLFSGQMVGVLAGEARRAPECAEGTNPRGILEFWPILPLPRGPVGHIPITPFHRPYPVRVGGYPTAFPP
jgi:hypothetical protein